MPQNQQNVIPFSARKVSSRGIALAAKGIGQVDVTPGAKNLFKSILSHFNKDDGRCFPTDADLVLDTGSNLTSVQRWKSELKKSDAIACTQPGFNRATVYRINFPYLGRLGERVQDKQKALRKKGKEKRVATIKRKLEEGSLTWSSDGSELESF